MTKAKKITLYATLLFLSVACFLIKNYINNQKAERVLVANELKDTITGLRIMSFATDSKHKIHQKLLQSSQYKVEVLGKGKRFRDLRDKFYAMKDYIIQHKLENSKELLMFIDGYDTLFAPGKQDIVEKFKKFGKPLVISAEINCYPYHTPYCLDKTLYPESPTIFRYVNSGTYIGEAWAVYKMVTESLTKYDDDNDQYLLHCFFMDNRDMIALDYNQEIFGLLYNTKFENYSYDQKADKIINLLTNSRPVIFHGNGSHVFLLLQLYEYYEIGGE